MTFDQPLISNECLNEIESIRHFERIFQNRYPNVNRWPVWFKSSLENLINQSHGPFAIFLNHDKSSFSPQFSREILCSPSILNLLTSYKCNIWPWDVTSPLNTKRLLERSGRVREILIECLCNATEINNYPLLLIVSRQKDRVILLDTIHGDSNYDQARSCLERTFNPMFDQPIVVSNESHSPGWIGGRTVGNIRRRPSFVTTFRFNRSVRASHRPAYISYYESKLHTPEIIVTMKEAQQWLNEKTLNIFTPKDFCSPVPSLSISNKEQHPFIYMSPRRAGWAPMLKR